MTAYEINRLISKAIYIRDMYVPHNEKGVITDLCNLVTDIEDIIADDRQEEDEQKSCDNCFHSDLCYAEGETPKCDYLHYLASNALDGAIADYVNRRKTVKS